MTNLNGAQALIGTLADCGVEACFANPGTSEMQLVAALDQEPRIRSALCLFEGVATGAADGYARIAGKPAMTLLHLGPGYANGAANLHNARRAFSPIVNVIGDHATYHRVYDAPLASDIKGFVAPNSAWTRSVEHVGDAGRLAAEAYAAAFGPPGGQADLILPADSAWLPGAQRAAPLPRRMAHTVPGARIEQAAASLRAAAKPVLLLGAGGCTPAGLAAAARLEAAGVRVLHDTFLARQARGAGHFAPARMQYFAEGALADLAGVDWMGLVGTKAPAAFFAYPTAASSFVPPGATVFSLADAAENAAQSLIDLADALGAPAQGAAPVLQRHDSPTGDLNPAAIGVSIARHLPEGAIVSDDGVTASLGVWLATQSAAPHDWLYLTGGAIGQGMPLAIGAAMARRDAKVVCLSGDGAGMYTNQALWTMAREGLPIVTIIFANRSYRILNIEMYRTGSGQPGPTAQAMLSLDRPAIDWAGLARAQGVPAESVRSAESFDAALARAMAADGPSLIEAVV